MTNINHIRDYLQGDTPRLEPVDIPGFLAWGARQGIAPLAYLAARAAQPEAPDLERERLAYLGHCTQVRAWQTALAQAVQALHQAGLDVLCFKGPSLAAQFWPTPPARRYADLDLLCRPAQAKAAEEVLFSLGYGYYYPVKRDLIAPVERRKEVVIYRLGATVVDLHHGAPLGEMAATGSLGNLFQRAVNFDLGQGQGIPTLSPEDTLLMLAWHGGKHLYHKLSQVLDVLFLLQNSPGLDWDYVREHARRNSLHKSLALALELVRRLFGHECALTGLPDAARLADVVIRRVIQSPDPEPGIVLALRIRAGQATGPRHLAREVYDKTLNPSFADVFHAGRRLPNAAYGLYRLHRLVTKGRNNV